MSVENQEAKIEKTAEQIGRHLNDRWQGFLKGWDLKQMTAEQVAGAVSKLVAEISDEAGYVDHNPDDDDTEQDQE